MSNPEEGTPDAESAEQLVQVIETESEEVNNEVVLMEDKTEDDQINTVITETTTAEDGSVIISLNDDATVNMDSDLNDVVSIKILDIDSSDKNNEEDQTITLVEEDIKQSDMSTEESAQFRKISSNQVLCNYCETLLSYDKDGTESLTNHLRTMHPSSDWQNVLSIENPPDESLGGDDDTTVVILKSPEDDPSFVSLSPTEKLFDRIKSDTDAIIIKCKLCQKRYVSKDDPITTMNTHLKQFHKEIDPNKDDNDPVNVRAYYKHIKGTEKVNCNFCKESFLIEESDEVLTNHLIKLHDIIPGAKIISNEMSPPKVRKERREARSAAWKFFHKLDGGESDEVECDLCGKRYFARGGSTTVMHRHLRREHPDQVKSDGNVHPSKKEVKDCRNTVWGYFEKVVDTSVGSQINLQCLLCHKKFEYTAQSSTGVMTKHLRIAHLKNYKEMMIAKGSGAVKDTPNKGTPVRSTAWLYFRKMSDRTVGCIICQKEYSNIGGSTSAMMRHLDKSHPEVMSKDSVKKAREAASSMKSPASKYAKVIPTSGDNVTNAAYNHLHKPSDVFTVVVQNNTPIIRRAGGANKKLTTSENTILEGFSEERSGDCSLSDARIITQDGVVVKTHKLVLASTSLLLYKALKELPPEEDAVIIAPDFTADGINAFMDRLYMGGDVPLDQSLDIVTHFGFRVEKLKYPSLDSFPEHTVIYEVHPKTETQANSSDIENEGEREPNSVYFGDYDPSAALLASMPKPMVVLKTGKRKSVIWNYYTKNPDNETATCSVCNKNVGCKQHSTSSLIKHLLRHHKEVYEEYAAIAPPPRRAHTTNPPLVRKRTTTSAAKDPADRSCPVCLKVFSTKNKMQMHHSAVHLGIKAYTCDVCGKSYSRVDTLRDHVASTHTVDGPKYLCKYCGKVFKRRATRFRHERFHRNDRRHQCSYCPKRFFTNQTLKNHERTHTGEKPFPCTMCNRRFAMMHQLTTHLRVHTGHKPYKCNYCNEAFKYSSSKNKHYCSAMPLAERTIAVHNRNKSRKGGVQMEIIEETVDGVALMNSRILEDSGEIIEEEVPEDEDEKLFATDAIKDDESSDEDMM